MDFGLSDEQQVFCEALDAFAAREIAPHAVADDRAARLRPELVAASARFGINGMRIAPEYGGQGADAVTCGLACERIARVDVSAAYLMLLPALVCEIINNGATAQQLAAWLPPIASGEALPALALTEPDHGSDAASIMLEARPDGADNWLLYGEKTSISFGVDATHAIVFARTSASEGRPAHGVSAFYLALDDAHVARAPFEDLGGRAIGRSTLAFDAHPAPASAMIGDEGEGFVRCMRGFDYSRALIGAMCVGSAQAALDDAFAYARQRITFGRPLGSHQGVSFPLVEAQARVRAARHLCFEALWQKDTGESPALVASLAKWMAPRVSTEAIQQALLTFGHAGYSEELPVAQRLRDTLGLQIADGTAQMALLVASRAILGRAFAP